jgi:hypothetical protein
VFSVLSVPSLYKEEQLLLRESTEAIVRRGGWCERAASLGVCQLEQRVSCETVAGQKRTWTPKLRKLWRWKPLPGHNRWRYRRLRFRTCYSELHSAWISVSDITFCNSSINPITNPRPVYSHSYTLQYIHLKGLRFHWFLASFYLRIWR